MYMSNEQLLKEMNYRLDKINEARKFLDDTFNTNCVCFCRSEVLNHVSIIKNEIRQFQALFETVSNQIFCKYKVNLEWDSSDNDLDLNE